MSVSDVVELNGVYYYCDHIGFKKIIEFCSWYILLDRRCRSRKVYPFYFSSIFNLHLSKNML
jgi:hypothetical protein